MARAASMERPEMLFRGAAPTPTPSLQGPKVSLGPSEGASATLERKADKGGKGMGSRRQKTFAHSSHKGRREGASELQARSDPRGIA